MQVKHVWELHPVVKLLVAQRVEVKDDPLQVHDESVGQPVDSHPLLKLNPLVACSALVVAYDFPRHKLFEAIVDGALVLDLEGKVVEGLSLLAQVAAALALHHRAGLAAKDVFEEVFLTRSSEQGLESVKAEVQELLGVFLLAYVGGLAIKRLEAEAERSRVVVLTVGKLQEAEHVHELVQQIVVDLLRFMNLKIFRSPVVCRKQAVA